MSHSRIPMYSQNVGVAYSKGCATQRFDWQAAARLPKPTWTILSVNVTMKLVTTPADSLSHEQYQVVRLPACFVAHLPP